ncbi:MAG TPA: dTDP-4-dehydrorhamnose reductase [Vicinamibacterales bacterium]|nr:dTDP-4-dehydrorhamnose reductase [Vicinamibacterales bacterium]
MKVLVTGGRGQLAGAIAEEFARDADVRAYSHEELDIADLQAVRDRVAADTPDIVVNCAAYNDVDRAEDEAERALTVNAFGVRVLARVAKEAGATLVHYSTDFVFDGVTDLPYREDDTPNPQSIYAQSKLLGEWFALEATRAFVLRVESLFGGAQAKSSVDRIVQAIASGQEARVFADRIVSPSYVVDVATATRALVKGGEPGLYHCVGTGHATWLEVGREIARVLGKDQDARLTPVPVASVPLRAPRPKFAALDNSRLHRLVPLPTWQDALRRYLA